MTMEMFKFISELAIIVACFIGVEVLIGKVFEHLLDYQNKRDTKAVETVNKLFDKIPDMFLKTVEAVEEYMEQKNKPTFKEVDDEDLTI